MIVAAIPDRRQLRTLKGTGGKRIELSMIGRDAVVSCEGATAYQLVLGDHSRIAIP